MVPRNQWPIKKVISLTGTYCLDTSQVPLPTYYQYSSTSCYLVLVVVDHSAVSEIIMTSLLPLEDAHFKKNRLFNSTRYGTW